MRSFGEASNESSEFVHVLVRIPKHSSVLSHLRVHESLLFHKESKFDDATSESKSNVDIHSQQLHLQVRCYHPGVLWRGLLPMLSASFQDSGIPDGKATKKHTKDNKKCSSLSLKRNRCTTNFLSVPQRALLGLGLDDAVKTYSKTMVARHSKILDTFEPSVDDLSSNNEDLSFFYEQRMRLPLTFPPTNGTQNKNGDPNRSDENNTTDMTSTNGTVVVWIFPPLTPPSDIDRTPFAAIVARIQRIISMQNGYNAWFSTLGGGYFGIKNLHKSLWLARQQKSLALMLGDFRMARQCTLNEAYNWMYSGRFPMARTVLDQLEQEVVAAIKPHTAEDDQIFLQRCAAARVFLRRLKKLSQKGLGTYHRIVHHDEQRQSRTIRTKDEFHRFRIVSC